MDTRILALEDIDKLEAGRELDALVAELVMGIEVVAHDWPCGVSAEDDVTFVAAICRADGDGPHSLYDQRGPVYKPADVGTWPPVPDMRTKGPKAYAYVEPVPFYSTEIPAAWEVAEHYGLLKPGKVDAYYIGQDIDQNGVPYYIALRYDGEEDVSTYMAAPTLPLLICRAVLSREKTRIEWERHLQEIEDAKSRLSFFREQS